MSRVAVVCFPGSNCEHDVVAAISSLGGAAEIVWHAETSLAGFDAVVLPGGFAHGDYLRTGAIARFSPVMGAVAAFATEGRPVLGICNGFQVLTEAGLVPGALMRNAGLRFICAPVGCVVASTTSVLTEGLVRGARLVLPINHYEGNYTCDATTLGALEAGGQVILRYAENPNGSVADIAGVANAAGNVVGLMPHPERAVDTLLGSVDGRPLLASFLAAADRAAAGLRRVS
jgi:phosphoribosylformylglycinamidine synthase